MSEERTLSFLTGLTHALVTVSDLEVAKDTGVIATVALCFGSNDDQLRGIRYISDAEGEKSWHVPHYKVIGGEQGIAPIFSGFLMKKLCEIGARALDRIRQDIGKPEYGKTYRVGETTEEVTE